VRDNAIQFAVVREDPRIEMEVLERHQCERLLLIASGGCVALSLATQRPSLAITLLDPNRAQLSLIERKIEALASPRSERMARFNVETSAPQGLSECGNFESLFRGLRQFLFEFVLPAADMRRLFCEPDALAEAPTLLFEQPYWTVAFQLFFSDPLLNTMFGPHATQHAEPGSYPPYFRTRFERALQRPDALDNPFLHHVFLGHYLDRPESLPPFLVEPAERYDFDVHHGFIDADVDLSSFDFIGLSNILDWMPADDVEQLMQKVLRETEDGAVVMWRQLNNHRDITRYLSPTFAFDNAWDRALWERDRSLFYSSLHVGVRQRNAT